MKQTCQTPWNTPPQNSPESDAFPKPPEITELLRKVNQLLIDGNPGKARDMVSQTKLISPWVSNAQGVCQLRLNYPGLALDVFRRLVSGTGGILLRADVPAVFKTNFATSLLMSHHLPGCFNVLAEVKEEDHPAVNRLRSAIRRWQDDLSFWQRLNWYLGGQPAHPVRLVFPAGDLE